MYVFLLGKAAGFIFGFMFGNLPGALLGVLLGHMVDRSLSRGLGGSWQTYSGAQTANRRQVFFASTFRVMGHIAKADGRVTEEEIRAARQVMQGMRLNSAQIREAIDCFNEGKEPDFDLDAELMRMNEACRGQPLLRQFFLQTQFFMAYAHGGVTGEERVALDRIGHALGLSQWQISQLEAQARMRSGFAGGNGRAGPGPAAADRGRLPRPGRFVPRQRPGGQDRLPPADEGEPPRQAGGPRPARSDDGARARAHARGQPGLRTDQGTARHGVIPPSHRRP